MGLRYYILDGHAAVPVEFLTWARWFKEDHERRIVATTSAAGAVVSTVFIGLDHRHGGNGPPLIFETLIFGGPHDGEMDRYSTWEEAQAGHARMAARVVEPVEG